MSFHQDCFKQRKYRKRLDKDKLDRLRERMDKLRNDIYVLIHIQDPDYLARMGSRKESYWKRLFKLEEVGIDKLKEKLAKMLLEEEKLDKELSEQMSYP